MSDEPVTNNHANQDDVSMNQDTTDRPTWVFVAGTYRTASTTQYCIARDVVEMTERGLGIGYHTEAKLAEFDITKNGPFVVCKVFKFLPETSEHGARFLEEGRVKALCTVRDPRDIIVSMRTRAENAGKWKRPNNGDSNDVWDFHKTATEDFPVWLGQLAQWIDLGPDVTLLSRFEEFTLNLFRETNRIADHLGISLPKGMAHKIASRYSIQEQRLRKRQKRDEGEREDPYLPSIPGIVFGSSGIWKSWLTPAESKLVEDHNTTFMKRFGYL